MKSGRSCARLIIFVLASNFTAGAQNISPDFWTFIGPQPTGKDASATSGRVTAMTVSPHDPQTVYLGSAGGGVWKTTDGGMHWRPLSDYEASLAVGSIAIDPSDENTIYVGTGETNACEDCYLGAGILKSTDGGSTWKQLTGPFVDSLGRGARIGSIAVNPSDGNVVLAAVYFVGTPGVPGIYRSIDAGKSWTSVLSQNQGTAVLFDAANPGIAYCAIYGVGVFRSPDTGATWTTINGSGDVSLPVSNAGRIDMALAASSPGTLYVAVADARPDGAGGSLGVYKTIDSGQAWSRLDNLPDYCQPQCSYNSVLAVDPANAHALYVGGIDLFRTLDSGQTWKSIRRGVNTVVLNSFQHAIAFAGDSSRIYVGNDGGAYSSTNASAANVTWSNLNSTLAIAQFFGGLSIHPADVNKAFGGAQGIGVQHYAGNPQWDSAICQDGGNTLMDSTNPMNVYASCQRTRVQKSDNGGASWSAATNGINIADRVQLAAPLTADPSNPLRIYFGTYRLYQSSDGAGSWTTISPDLTDGSGMLTTVAVAPADRNVVFIGTNNGKVQVTANALAGTSVFWTDLSGGLPSRAISKVAVDPANSLSAYIAFTGYESGQDLGHVFRIADFKRGWTNITGDLPNRSVNDLLIDPDIAGTVYAATDIGVFRTIDGGAHWLLLASGLPQVVVMGLTLHRPSRTLRAATHGRGVWDLFVPLPANSTGTPGLVSLTPAQAKPGTASLTVIVNGTGLAPGSVALWNGGPRTSNRISATELHVALSKDDLATPGLSQLTVMNPAPGGGVSNALNFAVALVPDVPPGSVVDAAGFQAHPIAPGSLASIFGSNLGFSNTSASAVPLPLSLNGTVLRLGGITAPLLFAGAGQITFQVPWELSGLDSVTVSAGVGGVAGNSQSVRLADFSPGIFTLDNPKNQAAVLIANSTVIAGPSSGAGERPAMRGEVVSIYCTGLGDVSNRPASGAPALAEPLSVTFATPVVNIGGATASTAFAGLAPGLVGTYLVNVRVPDDALTGDAVPIVISVGTAKSNTATMAVR